MGRTRKLPRDGSLRDDGKCFHRGDIGALDERLARLPALEVD